MVKEAGQSICQIELAIADPGLTVANQLRHLWLFRDPGEAAAQGGAPGVRSWR